MDIQFNALFHRNTLCLCASSFNKMRVDFLCYKYTLFVGGGYTYSSEKKRRKYDFQVHINEKSLSRPPLWFGCKIYIAFPFFFLYVYIF